MAAATQSPVTASPRCGRPLTTSYVDLMRPDEDWRNLPDAAERRKIQNRLAQRAYRRNMRDRTKEVEKLKKQLQQLQGSIGHNRTTPPPDHESSPSSGHGEATPPMSHSMQYQSWQGHEHLHGLGIRTEGDHPMAFESASFFHGIPGSGEMVNGIATPPPSTNPSSSRRSRAATSSVVQNAISANQQLRSNSIGPLAMQSNCPSPMPQWSASERRESMPVTTMAGTHSSPVMAVARDSYSMCSSPEDVSFLPAKAPYGMEQNMPHGGVYPPPPAEADMQPRASWAPNMDNASMGHGYMPGVTYDNVPDLSKSMPETSAPILHFAIASGNMETLRFLLQRPDINLNGHDNAGYTPMQRAISMGHHEMASLLMDHGASVETPSFKKPSYGSKIEQ